MMSTSPPVLALRRSFRRTILALVVAVMALWIGASSLHAQSADEVVADAVERWKAGVANVENFTVTQAVMGTETVTYYEKRVVDGTPTFVVVGRGPAGAETARSAAAPPAASGVTGAAAPAGRTSTGGPAGTNGIDLGQLKNTLVQSAAEAGMQALARELTGATENQVAGLLGSLGQQIQQRTGGGGGLPGGIGGALGQAAGLPGGGNLGGAAGQVLGALGGAGGLQGALLKAATDAGLGGLTGLLEGAAPGQLTRLLGGLEEAGGLGGIEQLGAMAARHGVQALLGGKLPGLGLPGGGAMGALGQGLSGNLTDPAAPSRGQMAMYPGMAQGQPLPAGMRQQVASAGGGPGLPALQMFRDSSEITEGVVGAAHMFPLLEEHASLRGRESSDGHDVFVLQVEDLGALGPDALPGLSGGEEFRPRELTVYLDREEYLLRGIRFAGTGTVEGEERELTVTVTPADYREVEGMPYPFRTTVSVEGLGEQLSDEERARMEQARQQYEMMQQQMKQMPPQQRAMVEDMMEQRFPQMEKMMESMAGGDALEMEVEVSDLQVNEGPPEGMETAGAQEAGISAAPAGAGNDDADPRVAAEADGQRDGSGEEKAADVDVAGDGDRAADGREGPGMGDGADRGGTQEAEFPDAAPPGTTATVGTIEMVVDGGTMTFDVRQGPEDEGYATGYGEFIRGESYVVGATLEGWHRDSGARISVTTAFARESREHYCDPFANQVRYRPADDSERSRQLRPGKGSSETCPPREGVAGITSLDINLREARYDPDAEVVYVAGDFAGPLGRGDDAWQVESATFEATLRPRENSRE